LTTPWSPDARPEILELFHITMGRPLLAVVTRTTGARLEQPIGFRRGHFLHVPSCSHEPMPGRQEAIAGKASAKFLRQPEGYSQLSVVQLSE
jgi:hypothetical protein